MLHHGANSTCRSLRAKRKAAFCFQRFTSKKLFHVATGNNSEHFFRNNIGGLTDAAHEQIRLFKQRGFNGLIATTTENLKCGLTEMIPKPHIIGKKIEGSLRCFHCHMLCAALFQNST